MKRTIWCGAKTPQAANIKLLNSWPSACRAILLLTATPEQLGMESHFARLRLLDPNRFHDFAQFVRRTAELPSGCGRCRSAAGDETS